MAHYTLLSTSANNEVLQCGVFGMKKEWEEIKCAAHEYVQMHEFKFTCHSCTHELCTRRHTHPYKHNV